MINRETLQSEIEQLEQKKDKVLSQPISSIVINERARKDLGDISSLAQSISSVGLIQPIVINENNELVDGQRRIRAYNQLGRTEIPVFRVDLQQTILGEFHANSNRKDFTSSERVKIAAAVDKYVLEHSRGVGRPGHNKSVSMKSTNSETGHIIDSGDVDTKNNVVNLTAFSGRQKDNVARYFGISRDSNKEDCKCFSKPRQS